MTGLMYVAGILSISLSGGISEWIIQQKWLSRSNTRKGFVVVGYLGSSICLALIPFVECSITGVMSLVLISRFFMGIPAGGDIPIAGGRLAMSF